MATRYKFRSKFPPERRANNAANLVGKKFGKLTVVRLSRVEEYVGVRNGKPAGKKRLRWSRSCDCGGTTEALTAVLKNGVKVNCGCSRRGTKEETARNRRLLNYRRGARERNLAFSLSTEHFETLITSDCHYCGCFPSAIEKWSSIPKTFNGIDRVDNSLGYTPENCVPCCVRCNRAKATMSATDFLSWIGEIFNHTYKEANDYVAV